MARYRDLVAEDQARSKRSGGVRSVERRSALESSLKTPSDRLIEIFGGRASSGANVNEGSALSISTVFACVRILAEGVAGLPLKLYKKTPDGRDEAREHPLYSLLKDAPNSYQTSFEWREMMQGHLALRGNAYSLIRRDRFYDVLSIDPVSPTDVQPIKADSGEVMYRYKGNLVTPGGILHLRGFGTDGVCGVSPIRMLREAIGLALTIQEHGGKSFSNGNRFPGIVKTAQSLRPEQVQKLREDWDKSRSGENATKVPIFHSGLDWTSVGMSNVDAELIASGIFQRKDIAEAYRIPMVMLAHGETAATYASHEGFMQSFVTHTLDPWLGRWEQRLNATLLSAKEQKEGYYFGFNLKALLSGNVKDRAAYYRTMREIRAIKINEIRSAEDMNDLPDNVGDNPREDFNGQGGRPDGKASETHPAETQADAAA